MGLYDLILFTIDHLLTERGVEFPETEANIWGCCVGLVGRQEDLEKSHVQTGKYGP